MKIDHKLEAKIECDWDHESGEVTLVEEVCGKFFTTIVATKDQKIREALIGLGWTPPEDE